MHSNFIHTLSSYSRKHPLRHPLGLSYSIIYSGLTQLSPVQLWLLLKCCHVVGVVVQVTLLVSSSTPLAISLEFYFIASHLFFIAYIS